ncbi:hypothetical protein CVIRNUC_009795 [Coccomyxa viridis]|uniref:Nucleotide-diphospho-sugar transferase domain-containing protein n=1 Tax=Coccomyxa viridis TaxID=1274662 RepID=A0AAV1IIE4_9CHLO|nr:hypothetical protein CVIRNUC_009795 [Coccomyxa viridis]
MALSGYRGAQTAVHSPSQELKETLYNAAYHDGAHGLHASAAMAIVTAGDRVHFARLLQRFLQGLKSSLDGDHSHHAVVVGMTRGAKSLCDGLRAQYSHHCALSSASRGHEGDDEEGDSSQLAAELHKLELVHEVLAFGYSAVYVELDTVFFHNPMQHLLSLQADVALPDNLCAVTINNKTLSGDRKLHQDTSLIFARAGPPASHFVHEWINTHRHELHRDISQGNLLRHNQAVLNEVPPTLRGPDKVPPAVRINALSQDRFPAGVPGPAAAWAASRWHR